MFKFRVGRIPVMVLLLICASAVGADSPPEKRVQQEVNAALVRLLANGEVSDADLAAMRLRHDGGRIARFGALLSATQGVRGRSGAEVIAVTPGSSAESMGLVPGDFIVGVNGAAASGGSLSSDSHPDPSEFIRAQLDQSIGDVSLLVERDGRELVLAGPILSVQLPAYRLDLGAAITQSALGDVSDPQQGCGRISVFDVAPRGRDLFPAVLIAIDGKAPGPSGRTSFRVDPGTRRLTVAEAIDDYEFSGVQQRQRRQGGKDRYVDLFVEVEAGRTYRLAAEFDAGGAGAIRPGSYWRPVIWSVVEEPCN